MVGLVVVNANGVEPGFFGNDFEVVELVRQGFQWVLGRGMR